PDRTRYLSEISESVRRYNGWVDEQSGVAHQLQAVNEVERLGAGVPELANKRAELARRLDQANPQLLENWEETPRRYDGEEFVYQVRGKDIKVPLTSETLSHNQVSKVALPTYRGWGDILRWSLQENVPGEFPFTAGVFPFKREGEDPTRMFAGEGGPE